MSDTSTNLQLPYLMPAQAQKHVTVNEALRRLDALCQATAVSMSVTAQPASPNDGDVYIVPPGKTGALWANAANWSIGYYADGVWEFVIPREGWVVWVRDAGHLVAWDGSAWVPQGIGPAIVQDSFSPTVAFGGNSAGVAYNSSNLAYYTRIGNFLIVSGRLALTNAGSSTGTVTIGNFPATLGAGRLGRSGCRVMFTQNLSFAGELSLLRSSGNNMELFGRAEGGSGWSAITHAAFANNTHVLFSGAFQIQG